MKNRELHCPKLSRKLKFVGEVIAELLKSGRWEVPEVGNKLPQVEAMDCNLHWLPGPLGGNKL